MSKKRRSVASRKPWLRTPSGAAALALCLGLDPAEAAANAMRDMGTKPKRRRTKP
jgi:hypothetical protein